MPLDEFWYGPVKNLEAYQKAYYMDLHNVGHVNGMYVGQAVASCLSKDAEYPKINLYEQSLNQGKTEKVIQDKSLSKKVYEAGSIKQRYLEKLKRQQEKRGD